MNVEIATKVIEQLRGFGQDEEAGHVITVLDALRNAGYVIHSATSVRCTDDWRTCGT